MTPEAFKKAKSIREQLKDLEAKKLQLKTMKSRDKDTEFTIAQQLAYDALCVLSDLLEKEFDEL